MRYKASRLASRCSDTDWLLVPAEEVSAAPAGITAMYSSVPAHIQWNHFKCSALATIFGLGQPRITVAWANCSGVAVRRPA